MTRSSTSRMGTLSALAVCLVCLAWLAVSTVTPPALARQAPSEPDPIQVLATILEPAAWAVSGLDDEQVEDVLENVAAEFDETIVALLESRADAVAFAEDLAAADDVLQRGGATDARLSARDTAQSGFDSATTAFRTAQADLKAAILDAISDVVGAQNAGMAQRWSDNALRKVPDAFKALDLGAEDWRVLESAWRSTQRGEELTGGQATALASAQGSAVTTTAEQRLGAGLAAITALLAEAAAGGE